ncbi:MAG: condensation domain-containing protein [Acidobacteriaceae bacterium]
MTPTELCEVSSVCETSTPPQSSPTPGAPAQETFVIPASLEQSRYWMLAQIDPGSTASNMAISFELEGALDPHILQASLTALIERHEALRTLFRLVDGQLSQIIIPDARYELTFFDLRESALEMLEDAISRRLSEHSHSAIDLQNGPVLKAQLIRAGEQRHILALTMNHIVCDGWSNGVLLRDLGTLYEAFRTARRPDLPELPFQFADFSIWQTEYLNSPRAAQALDFWREHMGGDLSALDLPGDYPRKPGRSFPGHIESQLMPPALDRLLQSYCKTHGSTKHIVLLAAFEALCARYSGQWKFLLGSTIANRTQPGMEHVVGRFANPQIIVADVTGNPSFAALEARIRDWETSAYTHQDLPFSRILEECQTQKAGAGSRFLQAWFIYQKAFMQPQQSGSLRMAPRRSVSGGVDFDLFLSVVERAEGPRVQVEYNTDLYSPQRIQALVASFLRLLEHALQQPETLVSELPLETAEPISGVQPAASLSAESSVRQSSSTEPQAHGELDLLARLARQAQLYPDRPIIQSSSGASSITWAALDERSSAVARRLEELGVRSGAHVVLQLAPLAASVIGVLGILKAGALPAPIAIRDLPDELQWAKESADALLVLTEKSLSTSESSHFCFEDFAKLPPHSTAPLDRLASTAWLSLTRDADGTARMQTIPLQRTLLLAQQAASRLGITAADALLSTFPGSSIDIWMETLICLISGASLCFTHDEPCEAMQPLLNRNQITWMAGEPALWRSLHQGGWRGDRRLHGIVRGRVCAVSNGRNLSGKTRSAWTLFHSPAMGGPVAAMQLDAEIGAQASFPLAQGKLEVQDAHGARVPSGAVGTLVSEGLGGATEFFAQAERDGSFRVIGRSNDFVHHRGTRIRLGEIRDALLEDPSLADAEVVLSNGDDASERATLLAYVTAAINAPLAVSNLRKLLSASLPSYMVPSEIVQVSHIARLSDGTPAHDRMQQRCGVVAAAPAGDDTAVDDVERQVAELWKQVLGRETLDPHATFFEAGGNSLLLVRLFARINKAFGTRLPITTIFDSGTVQQLAASLRHSAEISPVVAVQTRGTKRPLFMIHSYLLYQGLSNALGEDQPFYGLRELEQDGDLTIQERVSNYVREIRRIQPCGPYAVAGWCAAGPLTVEVARQLMDAGETVLSVILFDSWLPGYLESVEGARGRSGWLLNAANIRSRFNHFRSKTAGLSAWRTMKYVQGSIHRIAREGRDRLFIRHWNRLHQLSTRFHLTLPQFMYNTSLKTFATLQQYREEPLPLHLTLVRASDAREVKGAGLACGWDRVAQNGVDVLWAPGSHETMFIGKNLDATAALVRSSLAASDEAPSAQPEKAVPSTAGFGGEPVMTLAGAES